MTRTAEIGEAVCQANTDVTSMSRWQTVREPKFIGATGETERLSYNRGPAIDGGLDDVGGVMG